MLVLLANITAWLQRFDLPLGAATAVLWDDETDRGLQIRREKEIARLRDQDELCFRWNKPLRMHKEDKPWFVVQDESFPTMRHVEVTGYSSRCV